MLYFKHKKEKNMQNANIQDFYVDENNEVLKNSFSVDRNRLIFKDFDLDGWTFLGFKESHAVDIPTNMKGFVEPEKFYILDFLPISDKNYVVCSHYDAEDKELVDLIRSQPTTYFSRKKEIQSKFTKGKRIFQIKVSENFLKNFINNGFFANESLKSVITNVIETDKHYNQNWHTLPFMLLDDTGNYEKVLKETMENRLKKEVKTQNLTSKQAELYNKIFNNIIDGKSELLDLYYALNNGYNQVSNNYKALIIERKKEAIAIEKSRLAKLRYLEKKRKEAIKEATATNNKSNTVKQTKSDKTVGL